MKEAERDAFNLYPSAFPGVLPVSYLAEIQVRRLSPPPAIPIQMEKWESRGKA